MDLDNKRCEKMVSFEEFPISSSNYIAGYRIVENK